jgi:hypothetical protein
MGAMEKWSNGARREGGYVRGVRLRCLGLGVGYDDRALERSAGFVVYGWGR